MLTIEQTRAKLKAIPRKCRCHPTCKGWGIFEVNRSEGVEIEGCDECLLYFAPSARPTEDEIQQLPEAIRALENRIKEDGGYATLDAYDMDRALGMVAEWLEAGKSPDATLVAIGDVLREAGYDNRSW